MDVPTRTPVNDVINKIVEEFNNTYKNEEDGHKYKLSMKLNMDNHTLIMGIRVASVEKNFTIGGDLESFNMYFNQPLDYEPPITKSLTLNNVWDRCSALQFHASFVPFDNYQYLGAIFDNWNKPIIYQDANTSPLFNVWITTDMKHPINLLYEEFIFRFTFIIASNDQYHS